MSPRPPSTAPLVVTLAIGLLLAAGAGGCARPTTSSGAGESRSDGATATANATSPTVNATAAPSGKSVGTATASGSASPTSTPRAKPKPKPEPALPDAIVISTPREGGTVQSPARVKGTAQVNEGRVLLRVLDQKRRIVLDTTIKTASTPAERRPFDVKVPYPAGHAGPATWVFYEISPATGRPANIVEVHVYMR
jgi:hypothetical protein